MACDGRCDGQATGLGLHFMHAHLKTATLLGLAHPVPVVAAAPNSSTAKLLQATVEKHSNHQDTLHNGFIQTFKFGIRTQVLWCCQHRMIHLPCFKASSTASIVPHTHFGRDPMQSAHTCRRARCARALSSHAACSGRSFCWTFGKYIGSHAVQYKHANMRRWNRGQY